MKKLLLLCVIAVFTLGFAGCDDESALTCAQECQADYDICMAVCATSPARDADPDPPTCEDLCTTARDVVCLPACIASE